MKLNKSLLLDALSLTEAAAIACYDWIGRGKEKLADQAAVTAMREQFQKLDIHSKIVIGEGERDKAPMLYIGEELGNKNSNIVVDIAVDPLEGTTLCAHAAPNSISVLAMAPKGTLLYAPDVYMEKIAIGNGLPENLIDLDETPAINLQNLAKAKKSEIKDLTVCILNRTRHEEIIAKVRETGAKVQLIPDGDVTACLATIIGKRKIDMYLGTGGAPEGVLASAALKSLGGFFQGRLIYTEENQRQRTRDLGIKNPNAKLFIKDMVKDDVIFAASGVTDGWFLKGVVKNNSTATVSSFITHLGSNKSLFIKSSTI